VRVRLDRDHGFQSIVIINSRASWSRFPADRDRHFQRSWSAWKTMRRRSPLTVCNPG